MGNGKIGNLKDKNEEFKITCPYCKETVSVRNGTACKVNKSCDNEVLVDYMGVTPVVVWEERFNIGFLEID